MTALEQKEALVQYLRLQVQLEDWKAVRRIAKDLRKLEQLKLPRAPLTEERKTQASSTEALPDVMPTEMEIPHQYQEVRNILRMKDEELIEKLFPLPDEALDHAD